LERSKDIKDCIELSGNDINAVSQAAANLHCASMCYHQPLHLYLQYHSCMLGVVITIVRVRQKDIRKFLDGVYVSAKGPAVVEE
jgi:ribosomal protein L6P/L9E